MPALAVVARRPQRRVHAYGVWTVSHQSCPGPKPRLLSVADSDLLSQLALAELLEVPLYVGALGWWLQRLQEFG